MKQKKYIRERIVFGLMTGLLCGLVICLYRILMNLCDQFLSTHIFPSLHGGSIPVFLGWTAGLLILCLFVSLILHLEPEAEGGGIPHALREARGTSDSRWWSVILAKLVSAPLCILAGFSLGKTGPAIEMGCMSAKGVHCIWNRLVPDKTPRTAPAERCLSGSGSGLSALFNAPVSGLFFALEKFGGNADISLVTICTASLSAFLVSFTTFGYSPIMDVDIPILNAAYYPAFALMGIVLGVLGWLYAKSLNLFTKYLAENKKLPKHIIWSTLFLLAGVVGYFFPAITGGGNRLLDLLGSPSMTYGVLALLLLGKYLFSMISSGSGLPGGTVFPLLTVGACLGQLAGMAACQLFPAMGMSEGCFALAGMAGFFTAVMSAPLTGIFLLCEFSCNYLNFLPLCVVCLFSHITLQLINRQSKA